MVSLGGCLNTVPGGLFGVCVWAPTCVRVCDTVFLPQAVEKLVQAADSGCPSEPEKQMALNCARLLTRILPYIFEDPDWRGFFWSTVPGAGQAGVSAGCRCWGRGRGEGWGVSRGRGEGWGDLYALQQAHQLSVQMQPPQQFLVCLLVCVIMYLFIFYYHHAHFNPEFH